MTHSRPAPRRRPTTSRPSAEPLEARELLASFTVANTNDSGAGSLRQAILDAEGASGNKAIVFAIPGAGAHTIAVTSALPVIPINTVVDGWTQPGYQGSPLVEVDGLDAPRPSTISAQGIEGLRLSGNDGVRGLSIYGFAGDEILATGALDVIQGDNIGVEASGEVAPGADLGEVDRGGISLLNASQALIGGTTPGTPDVISGNHYGIFGKGATGTTIEGSIIGLDRAETRAIGNDLAGIDLIGASTANTIGGTAAGARDLISGNAVGIILGNADTPGPASNVVLGDRFGLDDRSVYFPNTSANLVIGPDGRGNTIGGAAAGAGDTFAGSTPDRPTTQDLGVGDQFPSDTTITPASLTDDVGVTAALVGTVAPDATFSVVFTVTNHGPTAAGQVTLSIDASMSQNLTRLSGSVPASAGVYDAYPTGPPGSEVATPIDIARFAPIGAGQSVQVTVAFQAGSLHTPPYKGGPDGTPSLTAAGTIEFVGTVPPGQDKSVQIEG